MKKLFLFLCVSCLVLLSSSYLLAGGVDNRSNLSGEYVGSLNRNAVTDSLDAIAYNPAGVMEMEDGFHTNLSLHYVMKDYTNIVDGDVLNQDTPSVVPALFGLYKEGKWASFFSFTIPSGGGKVEYNNGNATTRIGGTALRNMLNQAAGAAIYNDILNESVDAEGIYYGLTVGAAYQINDYISVSLAGRYVDANKKANATFQVAPTELGIGAGMPTRTVVADYEDTADGWGLIVGLGFDLDPLYIGMRYEAETDLVFKYNVKQDSITGLPVGLLSQLEEPIIDGWEHSRNLPGLFAVGLAAEITPKLKVNAGMTYYFQARADWGGSEQGRNVEDGREMGISVEYLFNDNIKGSIGYLKTSTGMNARYALKEAPELDAKSYGLGVQYNLNENFKMDFGIGYVSYARSSYTDISSGQSIAVALDKEVKMISAGGEYRF